MVQRVLDHTLLRLALMLFEIGLKLEFCLIGIQQELLSCTECQPANIAICHAGRDSNESDDFQISICHGNIMARHPD